MKNIIKYIVMLCIIATATPALAGPGEKAYVNVTPSATPGVYHLYYDAAQPGDVRLRVRDDDGFVLYRAHWTQVANETKQFDMNALPPGVYTFEIKDEHGRRELLVQHKMPTKPDVHVEIDPLADQRYRVKVRGERSEPVRINLYDGAQRLLRTDLVESEKDFSRVYDLSRLPYADVQFEVSTSRITLATYKTK
ncbi:MAG: hypothetical protein WBA12_00595 [Catalinimonas sp.]